MMRSSIFQLPHLPSGDRDAGLCMQMTSPERLAAPLRPCAADCSDGALCRHIWRMYIW